MRIWHKNIWHKWMIDVSYYSYKNNVKHRINIFACAVFLIVIGSVFSELNAQTMAPAKNSLVTKSVRPVGNIPVVYEHEVNGGIHQYAGTPWIDGDAVEVSLQRIRLGMLATNSNDNTTYRYIRTPFDPDAGASSNVAADWERVLLITMHDPAKTYAGGEIVISGTTLYQANADVIAGVNIPNALWDALETDDQKVDEFSISGNTLSLSIENDGEAAKTVSIPVETVVLDDRVTPANNTSITSGGETIILANTDVNDIPLANDPSVAGRTFTIKNVKATTSTSEINIYNITIDDMLFSAGAPLSLWRKNDYITILSDGTSWYKIAEGATNVVQPTANINDANDHDDAFYWGNPNQDNSWRIVFNETNNRLVIQRRESGSWKNKTSIVP